jgi:transcriptional regulator of heat shock response
MSMPQSVKERVRKLREEIAEISEANRLYVAGGKKIVGASDQERRLQRLQEIMDELKSLTDWKKP